MRATPLLLAAVAVGGLSGTSFLRPHQQSPLDQIRGYRSWTKVNKDPVDLSAEAAARCATFVDQASINSPHTLKSILVYVNRVGRSSMMTKQSPVFPIGTVIVKEKFDAAKVQQGKKLPDPELLTVMVKGLPGSSPATGDWTFFAVDGTGKKILEGKTDHCVQCHQRKKSDDWVFRDYIR